MDVNEIRQSKAWQSAIRTVIVGSVGFKAALRGAGLMKGRSIEEQKVLRLALSEDVAAQARRDSAKVEGPPTPIRVERTPAMTRAVEEIDQICAILRTEVRDLHLSDLHGQAIHLLALGVGKTETCRSLGITIATLRAWLAMDTFSGLLRFVTEEIRQYRLAKLHLAAGAALDTLIAGLEATVQGDNGPEPAWKERREAANSILDRSTDFTKGEKREVVVDVVKPASEMMTPAQAREEAARLRREKAPEVFDTKSREVLDT